mmetsp:Transcript_123170/g.394481  ORF Transcript_123170/g.394481 Transcript_123170/m.394481 type:complete len:213 (-) Transcript_123170:256-894(-)
MVRQRVWRLVARGRGAAAHPGPHRPLQDGGRAAGGPPRRHRCGSPLNRASCGSGGGLRLPGRRQTLGLRAEQRRGQVADALVVGGCGGALQGCLGRRAQSGRGGRVFRCEWVLPLVVGPRSMLFCSWAHDGRKALLCNRSGPSTGRRACSRRCHGDGSRLPVVRILRVLPRHRGLGCALRGDAPEQTQRSNVCAQGDARVHVLPLNLGHRGG